MNLHGSIATRIQCQCGCWTDSCSRQSKSRRELLPSRFGRAMTLTSVPVIPRERWWTKVAKLPGRLWLMSGDIATMMTDRSDRQPSKRKLVLIRVPLTAVLILLVPFLLPLAFRARRSTAFDALHGRVRQIWQTSASDAIALLRATFA